MKPLAIDLFCGLGGWTEGLLATGWDVIGFDIEQHAYDGERYPAQLVLQDVLTLHGSQFRTADLIVASPPCQFFSYTAMPWTKAKERAERTRADPEKLAERLALFNACFRIQREAIEAAGRFIPLILENVRGAQPWVGCSQYAFGSYHIWGDIPALMPTPGQSGVKVGGMGWYPPDDPRHQVGAAFNPAAQGRAFTAAREGRKNAGFRFDGSGRSFQSESVNRHVADIGGPRHEAEGVKQGGTWFHNNKSASRMYSSKSPARKAASAKIAKIPRPLSEWIGRVYHPGMTIGGRDA